MASQPGLEALLKRLDFSVEEVLDQLEVGIMVVDRNYRILATNRQFARIHGDRAGRQVEGRPCHQLSFGKRTPCPFDQCAVQQALQDGRFHSTVMIVGKETEGEKALELQAFPMRDPSTGKIAAVMEVVYDKTGEYESEKIRNRLIGIASHELRRPLNAIVQMTSCLEDRRRMKLDEKDVDEILSRVRNRANQATLDLDTLLKMHKFLSGALKPEKRPVLLYREVIEPVLRSYAEPFARKGMVATIEGPRDAEVECDPALLRMVFENLLDNAVKYANEETPIFVRHGKGNGRHHCCVMSCAEHIRDVGRLFQPFATRSKGGTGLGLPFCKAVLQAHGGDIRVRRCAFDGRAFTEPGKPAKRGEGDARLEPANSFCFTIPTG